MADTTAAYVAACKAWLAAANEQRRLTKLVHEVARSLRNKPGVRPFNEAPPPAPRGHVQPDHIPEAAWPSAADLSAASEAYAAAVTRMQETFMAIPAEDRLTQLNPHQFRERHPAPALPPL